MHESTIKLKVTGKKNLQYHNDSTPKLARTGFAWGTEPGCSTGEVYCCILALVLIYESKIDQN